MDKLTIITELKKLGHKHVSFSEDGLITTKTKDVVNWWKIENNQFVFIASYPIEEENE